MSEIDRLKEQLLDALDAHKRVRSDASSHQDSLGREVKEALRMRDVAEKDRSISQVSRCF